MLALGWCSVLHRVVGLRREAGTYRSCGSMRHCTNEKIWSPVIAMGVMLDPGSGIEGLRYWDATNLNLQNFYLCLLVREVPHPPSH